MKQCLRVKDSLTCSEDGKPCNNKDCTIVKMGYKAEDFEDTPTQHGNAQKLLSKREI